MPRLSGNRRNHADRIAAQRGGYPTATAAEMNRPCVGSNRCPETVFAGCPVPLCGRHMREVYGFAADMVSERWDEAVREYVSDLHGTFVPPRAVKQPLSGWVYFIRFGDRVKVGYTTKPDQRMRDLPHEQVIGILPGTRADEAAWHHLLADFHVVGEWFRADPQVLAMLGKVASSAS
jgi:Meiotically Up-regulated Gene 113 (MUG113) protein